MRRCTAGAAWATSAAWRPHRSRRTAASTRSRYRCLRSQRCSSCTRAPMSERGGDAGRHSDGRMRAVIENVAPCVDGGRFAVKRVVGDRVVVEADCFADGHDVLAARVLWRAEAERDWHEAPMTPIGNDRWRGSFDVDRLGRYVYTATAWVDPFLSWRHDFARREDAEDLRIAALAGADLVAAAAARAPQAERARLASWADRLRAERDPATLR